MRTILTFISCGMFALPAFADQLAEPVSIEATATVVSMCQVHDDGTGDCQ